ncbi:hypothetical protein YC2023_005132 [Brassica napus]
MVVRKARPMELFGHKVKVSKAMQRRTPWTKPEFQCLRLHVLEDFHGGISRLKQHLRRDHRNAKVYKVCPPHVREELNRHKKRKDDKIAARNMVLQVEEEGLDEYDEDGEKESQPRWSVHAKKKRVRGPLDMYVTTPPPDIFASKER